MVNFPFSDGDVPRVSSYDVFIFQLIRFVKVSNHLADFKATKETLTAKLVQQGNRHHKLRRAFSKFYNRPHKVNSRTQELIPRFTSSPKLQRERQTNTKKQPQN